MKSADDTVIANLLSNDKTSHGPVVDTFLKSCSEYFLELNVNKTKVMCVDFRLMYQVLSGL